MADNFTAEGSAALPPEKEFGWFQRAGIRCKAKSGSWLSFAGIEFSAVAD
jgi:hypothetical protein